jgi:hypothetical protein
VREAPADGSRVIMFSNNSQCSAFNRRKVREHVAGDWWRLTPIDRRLSKIREILEVVNTELGSVEFEDDKLARSKIFLYINDRKKVIGCVVTEHITRAYKCVLNETEQSERSVHVKSDPGSATCCR